VLGSKLGYDACNHLLAEARFFTEQVLLRGPRTAEALRYLYLSIAYFLVSLDFAVSGFPFLASDEHQRRIEDGIRYGTAGRAATEKIADVAARIASASVPNSNATAIREAVRKTSEGYPAEVLGEFFGRTSVQNSLFHLAREFNVLAYSRDLALPSDLTNESKATLLVLLDFLKVSRPEFVSVAGSARQGGSDQAEMVVKSTKRAGEVQGELRIVEGDRPDLPG
jgi:hypothetical protein